MEAVMRRMEEVLRMHMQGLREEIAGLKREIREQEKQKEEEGLATQIQRSEDNHARSPEEQDLGEHEVCEKKQDEAKMKNHNPEERNVKIMNHDKVQKSSRPTMTEESDSSSSVVRKKSEPDMGLVPLVSRSVNSCYMRGSVETEGMMLKKESAPTMNEWNSSKLDYPPPPPPHKPPDASLPVEGGSLSPSKSRKPPYLDLWTASHGKFVHDVFTKSETRSDGRKKKEGGGARMELQKFGHLLDLMGQAQFNGEKKRA